MMDYIPNLRDDFVDNTGKPYVGMQLDKNGEVEFALREDGMVSMFFDIEDDLWMAITKEAHRKDVTINSYIVDLLVKYANEILKNEETGD